MAKNNIAGALGFILAKNHVIPFHEVRNIIKNFKRQDEIAFEDFLMEEEITTKPELLQALSEYYGVPAFDVNGEFVEHYLLRLFPKGEMLRHFFFPIGRENDILTVVVADPSDIHVQEVIGKYISHDLNITVGLAQDIRDAINEFYDQSITYQPNDIDNQQMERSAMTVYPRDDLTEQGLPHVSEETDDDYEK